MKYLRYLLIVLLFIPFIVLAEDCDISKITIISMEKSGMEGNTEELSTPTYQDRSINLDLKMYEVGDSITYDVTIKNDSDEDYMIDEDTFKTDSNYIEYTLKINDNTNVVKAKSSKKLTLIVTYKKEVEDDKLTNNKFNASNSLKLSLNTKEKVKELDIITTDNIKKSIDLVKINNPLTSDSIKLITIILLTVIAIIFLTIINKKKYNKYLILILSISLLPIVYAVCKCDIEVESTIEIEKRSKLHETIANLSKEDNACVTKYEGEVTDEVGLTETATKVYFDKCVEKRNVIFNNMCWQVIRTTETGGTKLIYNGEPVDGKCESTRGNHKGIVQSGYGTQTINSNYLYGSSFTYNTTTSEFTLVNTTTSTWSDSTYQDLLGKFTCKTTSDTCTTLYQINSYDTDTNAYLSYYTITDTNYAQIGTSSFNANEKSPAMVGYMFNKVYISQYKSVKGTEYKYGSSFTYDTNTNTYTLSGTTYNISDWGDSLSRTILNSNRYTCWNTTGVCNAISYIHNFSIFLNPPNSYITVYHINIMDGKNVNDALEEMLFNDNVNRYNSSVKGIIDSWYSQNLSSKINMLEDTVYCNARSITNYGGWGPNGNGISILFKSSNLMNDLSCYNVTDQFAVSNNKAKLTYPISLINNEEWNNIGIDSLRQTGDYYWTLSPYSFSAPIAGVYNVSNSGRVYGYYNCLPFGSRPAVSLNSNTLIMGGTGSETDPWIIE